MDFLNPWGLLALLALAPVIALYFLKLKREQRLVPSCLLWKKVIRDLHVNSPFQRLRYSLLLLLQLVCIAVLGFALARPFMALATTRARALILLVDTSASMGTRDAGSDGQRTRLEQAVLDAQAKTDEMSRGGLMQVVAFDEEVRQVTPLTGDKAQLREALAGLKPRDLSTRAQEALETALALAAETEDAEVLMLSDGAFGPLSLQRLLGSEAAATNLENLPLSALRHTLRFVPYGREETDNIGITRIRARTRTYVNEYVNQKKEEKLETQLFVRVENFAGGDVEVILTLEIEGHRAETKVLSLKGRFAGEPPSGPAAAAAGAPGVPARESASDEVFQLRDVTGVVTVRVARADGGQDRFPLDNQAQVVIGAAEGTRALLVTAGNYFLERALAAMREATVTKRAPDAFQAQWASPARGAATVEDFDAVVFDGVAPPEWKDGGAVFLNVCPPLDGFRAEPRAPLEWPKILDWKADHPVLRYVTFSNVLIAKAHVWSVPKTAVVLVESPAAPLVVACETDRIHAVGVAFDLFESDWAYRVSLPLFLRNAVLWAGEVSPRRRPSVVKTGEPLVVPPVAGGAMASLRRPDGTEARVELSSDRKTFVKGVAQVGLYRLTGLPAEMLWAANLTDPQESDNARRGALQLGDQQIVAAPAAITTKHEVWPWLALAAAGLLLLEWLVYHRRLGV